MQLVCTITFAQNKKSLQQLSDLITYLFQNSPFYQNWFKAQNISISDISSIEDLKKLRTVSKQDFAAHNMDFLCCNQNKIADFCTTSGTTGNAVMVPLTENDINRLAENEARTFTLAELNTSDVCMLMLTLDKQFMAGIAYYEGLRKLKIPAVRSGSVSPQTQLKNILQFKPTVLVAVPSFILKVIEESSAQGIEINSLSVKKIICIGEAIRDENLEPNNLAKNILANWNVQLFSTHASSEMQTAFSECTHGKGNHINSNLIIAEILDEKGNEVPNGDIGELTITTFGVEAMPLLRYRTGDIVFAIHETCECGSNEMRISPVLGRKNEMLKYKGTTIFPSSIFNVLQSQSFIKDFLVEAESKEGRTEKLVVNICCTEQTENFKQNLENFFRTALRVTPEIKFCSESELAAMRPAENRKIQRFVTR